MADDRLEQIHQAFMQDVLPVGLAMMERVKAGDLKKVVEEFTSSSNSLEELRTQGEPKAKIFRDRLDQVSPGLGNPVMKVTVEVDQESVNTDEMQNHESLMVVLNRIHSRLETLEHCLQENPTDFSAAVVDQD